jgi:hypothetical protein
MHIMAAIWHRFSVFSVELRVSEYASIMLLRPLTSCVRLCQPSEKR